jgi:hypothetical protein
VAKLPVLVISCDRYADLWRPFFDVFWRRWPDCAGPVYLGANFQAFDDPRVRTVRVGHDVTWAASARTMLDHIDAPYLVVMLEDFLLMHRVDNARIERLADVAVTEELGCLRLYSIFPPETALPRYPELAAFAPGGNWRITAQAAIWRVETLRRLLVPGFSAWDFELLGSRLSDYLPDRIWGVRQPALVYDHAVEKGRWTPHGLEICRAAGVVPDLSRRGAFTAAELDTHERAAILASRQALRKSEAINHFKLGHRRAGLRAMLRCLRRSPASPQLWGIAGAGLLGPAAIAWLQRVHVGGKVARATRAYARAVRSAPPDEQRLAPIRAANREP